MKLSKLELQILEALWAHGKASIREIQEAFPEPRPAYTTIQTTVYRLEGKKALRRVRKIGNADIFEPIVSRDVTRNRLLDEIKQPAGTCTFSRPPIVRGNVIVGPAVVRRNLIEIEAEHKKANGR